MSVASQLNGSVSVPLASRPAARFETESLQNGHPRLNGAHSDSTDYDSSSGSRALNGNSTKRPGMSRKASSPMAPAFMVSAPGKVIVYGEHAVVYGRAALAAAISLRSYLLKTTYYDRVTSLDPELLKAIEPHLENVSLNVPEETRKPHVRSALAFLFLFMSLGSPESPGAIYTLRSTIPTGAGLGSSASVCVCMSAALLLQIRTLAGPHPDQEPAEAESQIDRINRWAFVGEMCIHGNPSGVDNTVSAGGKAVIFRRVDYAKPPIVTSLPAFPELPLLIVDTQQTRSTAIEVAKVGALKKAHPVVTESILDAIDQVTTSAQDLLQSPDFDGSSDDTTAHFGTLMRLNHGLLVSLGVSHPRLERIRELVDQSDIGWTKLTGAGGGGCAVTLLRPNAEPEAVLNLKNQLAQEGFAKYQTTLGGDGIGVLYPAVLRNGSDDEEGGEEIDQQKFENAEGHAGIERLVGVGFHEKRQGWKFWKRATD
ncbi:hypothetical protein N7470_004766 [Penicillium chermesinum]|nr:hypothetical protein N7470_004766 [Penicillium chermesinum]